MAKSRGTESSTNIGSSKQLKSSLHLKRCNKNNSTGCPGGVLIAGNEKFFQKKNNLYSLSSTQIMPEITDNNARQSHEFPTSSCRIPSPVLTAHDG